MNTRLPPPPESYRRSHKWMGPVLHRLHVSCRDFADLSLQSMDRPLTFTESLRYRFHFIMCSVCRKFEKQVRSLSALAKAAFNAREPRAPDPEFLASTREHLTKLAGGEP